VSKNVSKASGGCLCGNVRYAVAGPLRPVIACHCEQCRRTSGHHVAATAAPLEAVRITGEPVWFASSPGFARGFCGTCGSNLFWREAGSGQISIFAGTLDAPTGLKLARHIFVQDKSDYYDITDDLPQSGDGGDARL
jgi:hypothetical protein